MYGVNVVVGSRPDEIVGFTGFPFGRIIARSVSEDSRGSESKIRN